MKRLFATITALLLLLTAGCSAEEPPQAQMVNPIRTVDSPEDFPDDLSTYLFVTEKAQDPAYSIISGEIAQIRFTYQGAEFTLRGTYLEGDHSGVYGPFTEEEIALTLDHPKSGCNIQIRYTTGGIVVANWSISSMQFSLASSKPTQEDDFQLLTDLIVSQQLNLT